MESGAQKLHNVGKLQEFLNRIMQRIRSIITLALCRGLFSHCYDIWRAYLTVLDIKKYMSILARYV